MDAVPAHTHPPIPERTVFRGACAQAGVREAQCFNPEGLSALPGAGRRSPSSPETNPRKKTNKAGGSLYHLQSLSEVAEERDGYRATTVKLEKHVESLCQELAQLYQKYEIKVEVCQR